MKKTQLHLMNLLALAALPSILLFVPRTSAQNVPAQDDQRLDNAATRQAQDKYGARPSQDQDNDAKRQDNDATRGQLARFDDFLDAHPEIAQQLRKNPSLVNNKDFVTKHPALQSFLQDQPGVRDQLRQNPSAFMRQENAFDRREDVQDKRPQLARFDQFLDSHREIAEQLRKNPSLVNNKDFVTKHPALQSFLQDQPGVRDQLRQNPSAFMQQENTFDRREDAGNNRANDRASDTNRPGDRDNNTRVADRDNNARPTDRDDIRTVDRDNNRTADRDNNARPTDRDDIRTVDRDNNRTADRDNNARPTDRDDIRTVDRDNNRTADRDNNARPTDRDDIRTVDRDNNRTGDVTRAGQNGRQDEHFNNSVVSPDHRVSANERGVSIAPRGQDSHGQFGEFLGSHSDISKDLSKNPSLVKNHDYVQKHPELQAYLNNHPDVRDQLMQNPQDFMKQAQQPSTATGTTVGATVDGSANGNAKTGADTSQPPKAPPVNSKPTK